jgi:hypothetical protein
MFLSVLVIDVMKLYSWLGFHEMVRVGGQDAGEAS